MAERAQNVLHARVNEAGAGTYVQVAATAEYRVRVLGLVLSTSAAQMVTLRDDTAALADIYLAQDAAAVLPIDDAGWVQTVGGEALSLTLAGAGAVVGVLVYQLVPSHWQ